MTDLETRVAKQIYEDEVTLSWAQAKRCARIAITALREWEKEQASAPCVHLSRSFNGDHCLTCGAKFVEGIIQP